METRAVEQQDAADEVRAFTMAALAADLGVRRTREMSDNYLRIIPVDPHLIPPKDVAQRAVELVGPLFPEADEVVAKSFGHPVFIDQGANLEAIICPVCAARLAFYPPDKAESVRAWWYGVTDPLEEHSVTDVVVAMICCQAQVPFSELRYDWPAGVASFEISVMNPGRSEPLTPEEQAGLEMVLGCGIRHIWAHY